MDPVLTDILGALKALGWGSGPVFAYLWWLERKDRREAWKAHNTLLIRTVEANERHVAALDKLTARVSA